VSSSHPTLDYVYDIPLSLTRAQFYFVPVALTEFSRYKVEKPQKQCIIDVSVTDELS